MIVVAGVAGSGKSTIGAELARRLGARFLDADTLHSRRNRAKLRSGVPLTDADRAPWLEAVSRQIHDALERGERLVVACSALKRIYRRRLDPHRDGRVLWAFLEGAPEVLASRLARRTNHFMNPALLADQLANFEPPDADENALSVAIDSPPGEMVSSILSRCTAPGI